MHASWKRVGLVSGCAALAISIVLVADFAAATAPDKYGLKVPGGLAFSTFKGFESWQLISLSHGETMMAAILGNPAMVKAYQAGIPENGKPFPNGAKMAKIHWLPKMSAKAPGPTSVPGTLHDVDLMEKDSKKFADSGGWGYGTFVYDAASDTWRPGNTSDHPPQANDAKCGFACHTRVKDRDFVFTEYAKR